MWSVVVALLELIERLAALIPPPRLHRHRYHGVLAPNDVGDNGSGLLHPGSNHSIG